MPVKCLNQAEKNAIVAVYGGTSQSITELSYEYRVSRRTIIRVLQEFGVDPEIRSRTKPADPKQQVLPMEAMEDLADPSPHEAAEVAQAQATTIPTKTPWYRRLKEWLFGTQAQRDHSAAHTPRHQ